MQLSHGGITVLYRMQRERVGIEAFIEPCVRGNMNRVAHSSKVYGVSSQPLSDMLERRKGKVSSYMNQSIDIMPQHAPDILHAKTTRACLVLKCPSHPSIL